MKTEYHKGSHIKHARFVLQIHLQKTAIYYDTVELDDMSLTSLYSIVVTYRGVVMCQ